MIMAKNKADKTLSKPKRSDYELPSVLSFKRSFEITDAAMSAFRVMNGVSEEADIVLYDHGQRTTKSHETTKKSGDTQRSGEDSANLVYGQQAKLPVGFDTLAVSFSMLVLEIPVNPDQCASDIWYKALQRSVASAKESGSVDLLARFYAYNIANGSWLWRNKVSASQVEIVATFNGTKLVIKDALDLMPYPVLPKDSEGDGDPHEQFKPIDALAKAIAASLCGDVKPLRIDIAAKVKMMPGQSVWPSQKYNPTKRVVGKQSNGKEIVSSRDFYVFGGKPCIVAEKVGSALRTFDRDHNHPVYTSEIIPAEPNGGSLKLGINLRRNGNDLRSLLPIFIGIKKEEGCAEFMALSREDEQYVMGCIIRGGIFGAAKAEDAPKSETQAEEQKEVA
jgi:CRISPR-associated protein Csy3